MKMLSILRALRGAPWGLVGTIALIALIESRVRSDEIFFLSTLQFDWKLSSGKAKAEAPKCDVLCFGDSLIKEGVVPKILSERLGLSVYNLGINGGMAPADYYLLRRAIDGGGRPSAILVDFEPHLLTNGCAYNADCWSLLLNVRECLDLAWTLGDARLFGSLMASKVFPSYASRTQIRANVLKAFEGNHDWLFYHTGMYIRNWAVNRGAQVMPVNPAFQGTIEASHGAFFPRTFGADAMTSIYMRRFLGLAASRGIPVYWLLPPIAPAGQALRDSSGLDAAHTEIVRGVKAEYPNVVVIDGRRAGYPHTVFNDPFHLNCEGATAFTSEIAGLLSETIADSSAQSTWLDLPRHVGPAEYPLEDVQESHLAQAAQAERRRR
jgi:hypothetical protein